MKMEVVEQLPKTAQDEDLGKRLAHGYPFQEPEVDCCDRRISKVKIYSFKGRPIMLLFSAVTTYRHKDIAMWFQVVFQNLCNGTVPCGPYYDHVLGYKKASLEKSKNVYIIGYEEPKGDARTHVKRLAEFIGYPFEGDGQEKFPEIERILSTNCLMENIQQTPHQRGL
ncbi:hypothetical protein ACFE04_010545 [Oxalis oulophora]